MKTKQYAVPEGCKITSVDFQNGVVVYECEELDMIEIGQEYWWVDFDSDIETFEVYYTDESYTKKPYSTNRFKTEQLAQTACDKLNEVLNTLKHY